eukprot:CAMPEP_0202701464 /NCGR_PEP_ID=MMETSP1385-20130828/14557_1 /ASSEMBLY_ACC=CAM_ASM_000861 /TAXON_ID=933848 /ORGANISM="Elphidium margaritaceum" /LENGTH=159 /DNA_ID=CAMNT_0049358893 /DNA_START=32 /DNA_END=511 /DNA_ORIENTATION=-
MSVFNKLVLRQNASRSNKAVTNLVYRSNFPLGRIQKRLFSGPWTHQPIPPDATWLERWAVRDHADWLLMLGGDFALSFFWAYYWIYHWCIESDAHKIDFYNNWKAPPIVPNRNNYVNYMLARWFPTNHFERYKHNHKQPKRRPYQVDGYQIDDPINKQI